MIVIDVKKVNALSLTRAAVPANPATQQFRYSELNSKVYPSSAPDGENPGVLSDSCSEPVFLGGIICLRFGERSERVKSSRRIATRNRFALNESEKRRSEGLDRRVVIVALDLGVGLRQVHKQPCPDTIRPALSRRPTHAWYFSYGGLFSGQIGSFEAALPSRTAFFVLQ